MQPGSAQYSGREAAATAKSAPGFVLDDTEYFQQALENEAQFRADNGVASGERVPRALQSGYDEVWGTQSRDAVAHSVLSGNGVGSANDLSTLPAGRVQAVWELPTLRILGTGVAGLTVLGGALNIREASTDSLPIPLRLTSALGGSLEVTGGITYGVSALAADSPMMMAAGGTVMEAGGMIAVPPVAVYTEYRFVEHVAQEASIMSRLQISRWIGMPY